MNQEKRKRVRNLVVALLVLPLCLAVGYPLIRKLDEPYRRFFAIMLGAMAGGTIVYMTLRAFKSEDVEESSSDDSQDSGDDS